MNAASGNLVCRICANDQANTPYRIREMLYGTRETFNYFQCNTCGCLQIAQIPDDLALHYPEDFISFRRFDQLTGSRLRRFVDPHRVRHALGHFDPVGWLANKCAKPLDYAAWIKQAGLGTDARILDVGCGSGKLLMRMKLGGFHNCTGIDPFIRETLRYPNGLVIHKTNLDAFSAGAAPFDLVMLHQTLAHMSDPLKALHIAARMLSDKGSILITVPVADSQAWERYREAWYNIDAPRHLHIPTRTSIAHLADLAGLHVVHIHSTGTIAQFAESEHYLNDIPGNAPAHMRMHERRKMKKWQKLTEQLNREGKGDEAMFYLRAHKMAA